MSVEGVQPSHVCHSGLHQHLVSDLCCSQQEEQLPGTVVLLVTMQLHVNTNR